MKLKNIYFFIHKSYWPYWLGAIIIGILNVLLSIVYRPWGVTANLASFGLRIWQLLGGHPLEDLPGYVRWANAIALKGNFLLAEDTLVNLGVLFGVLFASITASEFRIKKVKNKSQLYRGIVGGLLMGFGARIALGCNVGAIVSGVASQSLHGWLYAIFSYLGALFCATFFAYHYSNKY